MSSIEASASSRLWVPGMHLDDEYPVPGDEELRELWQDYTGAEPYSLNGVYGVYSKPADVQAVASIDLCEVVRETSISMHLSLGDENPDRHYSVGRWYGIEAVGEDFERSVVVSVIRVLLAHNHVAPHEDVSHIRSILQDWRSQGVYTVANTSTLPGCESSTIVHTLGGTLPDCFDALVLPRNHDGKGKTTKAGALAVLATEAEIPIYEVPLVHIDDALHHIEAFQTTYADHSRSRFFMPHSIKEHVNGHLEKPHTPLEAFEAADEHFREHGVIK